MALFMGFPGWAGLILHTQTTPGLPLKCELEPWVGREAEDPGPREGSLLLTLNSALPLPGCVTSI